MQRLLHTDLGNALVWGSMTFGILVGIAGLLWLLGRMMGGN